MSALDNASNFLFCCDLLRMSVFWEEKFGDVIMFALILLYDGQLLFVDSDLQKVERMESHHI